MRVPLTDNRARRKGNVMSAEEKLEIALKMLADWCVAVDENGAGWDDWDECYKNAMHRASPIRADLDDAIEKSRAERF